MKRRAAAVALAIAGLAFSALPAQAAPTEVTVPTPEPAAAPDTQTILVTLDSAGSDPEATAEAAVSKAAEVVGDAQISEVRRVTTTTVAVTLSGGLTSSEADQVAATVDAQRNVKTADTATTFYPADNDEPSLWDITGDATKYGVAADHVWGTTMGTGIRVGVVDTGITDHPDLNANVIAGYDFVSSLGGDGDGWDSDPSDEGDFHTDKDTGKPVNSSWHGTHVAGTIATVRNNTGVVGVAPSAKIEPLRVLGANGGSEADVIAAIRWAVGDKNVYDPVTGTPLPANPQPVQVLNLSLGGPTDEGCHAEMQAAINYAVFTKGVPVVVAAGNFGQQLYYFSPANCANVIRVTASTFDGTVAGYSNYGDYWDPATIAAPGGSGYKTPCNSSGGECGGILSTTNSGPTLPVAAAYTWMVGTSMAAPHVSGVLALLRARHSTWSVAQLTAAISGSATTMTGCSAVQCGPGIVNAARAFTITNFLVTKKSPSISGKFKVGKTLKVKAGSWSAKVKVTYRWLRNGFPISKATKSKYKLTKKDKGKWVSVQVTVTGPASYAKLVKVPTAHKVKA